MIVVLATMRALEGKEHNVSDILTALVVESRQEEGCLHYELLVGDEDPRELALYENWESDVALNKHLRSKHIEVAYNLADEFIEGKPRVVSYVRIEPVRTRHTGPTRRLEAEDPT